MDLLGQRLKVRQYKLKKQQRSFQRPEDHCCFYIRKH